MTNFSLTPSCSQPPFKHEIHIRRGNADFYGFESDKQSGGQDKLSLATHLPSHL